MGTFWLLRPNHSFLSKVLHLQFINQRIELAFSFLWSLHQVPLVFFEVLVLMWWLLLNSLCVMALWKKVLLCPSRDCQIGWLRQLCLTRQQSSLTRWPNLLFFCRSVGMKQNASCDCNCGSVNSGWPKVLCTLSRTFRVTETECWATLAYYT